MEDLIQKRIDSNIHWIEEIINKLENKFGEEVQKALRLNDRMLHMVAKNGTLTIEFDEKHFKPVVVNFLIQKGWYEH